METMMCFCQPEHMDNTDFFKMLIALIKVYEQYGGPFGCCKNTTSHIEKVVAKAILEAKEQGHLLTTNKVMAMKRMGEQKVQDLTIASALINRANKRRNGELQASLVDTYTLELTDTLTWSRKQW